MTLLLQAFRDTATGNRTTKWPETSPVSFRSYSKWTQRSQDKYQPSTELHYSQPGVLDDCLLRICYQVNSVLPRAIRYKVYPQPPYKVVEQIQWTIVQDRKRQVPPPHQIKEKVSPREIQIKYKVCPKDCIYDLKRNLDMGNVWWRADSLGCLRHWERDGQEQNMLENPYNFSLSRTTSASTSSFNDQTMGPAHDGSWTPD